MAQPVNGITNFDDLLDGTALAGAGGSSAGGAGLTASNVDGWNITLQSSNSAPDSQIEVGTGVFSPPGDETIDGVSQGGSDLDVLSVASNDGDLFTLESVDVGISGLPDLDPSGPVTVVGYRDGAAVAGATQTETVFDNGTLITFDVSSDSAFQNIDSFQIQTAGYSVTSAFGLDNINAQDFVAPGPVVTTELGSTAFTAGNNTVSTPVAVDSGLTLSDASSTTLASATVSITGNFHSGEDLLGFTNDGVTMGNVSGSYNALTGVLTLTSSGATATAAQFQAALQAVTYSDVAVTPNNATRTISFTANDGSNTSVASTRTVTVSDTDHTPLLNTTGSMLAYVSGSSAAVIDGGVTVSDLDNTTLASGTVSIGSGFQAGDTLGFTNTSAILFGNVSASYDAGTGVMTLTSPGATATDAQWANALDAVTFASTSGVPGSRSIGYTVNDGSQSSAAGTDQVMVSVPPAVITDSGSAAFIAGDNTASTPVAVDSGLTLSDASSATLASATVSITGSFQSGEDLLTFTNNPATMGNVTGSYDAGTGVLTLNSSGATATLAQFQAALQAVTYSDVAVTPNNATRTISFTANDGSNTSVASTRTVTVTDTDQTPLLNTTGSMLAYVSGSSAAVIDGGVTVSDLDNTTLASGTVSIGSGFQAGDTLGFTNTNAILFGNVSASYDAGTGVMTLTSPGATATDAQWANALDAVTFASTSGTPGSRSIGYTINDGTQNSAAGTDYVTVSVPPAVTTDSGSAAFTAGDNTASTPIVIDSGLTLSDASSATLASATVSITGNFHSGEDVLVFVNNPATMGNVTGSYNAVTGVLSLSSAGATATLAQFQAALRSVAYSDIAVTPNNATRTISFTANDGSNDSAISTRMVTVSDTDQTPLLTTSGNTLTYISGSPAAVIDGGVTVGDLDNPTLASGTVSIGSGFQVGDALGFTNTSAALFGNVSASYNAITGVLTLTSSGATATDAQWQNALDAVTFASTSGAPGGRSIQYVVNDGSQNSAAGSDQVSVGAGPTVTTDSGAVAFVAGNNVASTPVAVDSGLTLADPASTTLASATVSVTGNFQAGEDVLAFINDGTTMGNVAGSYDAGTGVLTLTSAGATATLAQFQAALQAVTYTDTAVTPNNATRTVSVAVNDGSNASPTATRALTVADTEQTPVVAASGQTLSYLSNAAAATIGGLSVSDRDNTTLATGTVSIGAGFQTGDVLAFDNTSAGTFGNIVASYNTGSGVLSLSSAGTTATVAQWQAALDAVTFASTSGVPGSRSVAFAVNDGSQSSVVTSQTVQVLGTTVLGDTVTITGTATVSNTLTLPPGPLLIGGPLSSPATLTLQGGTLTSSGTTTGVSGITLGGAAGTSGTAAVTGAGSTIDANGARLTVGDAGAGTLTVSGGGIARAGASYVDTEAALAVGASAGGVGTLTVSGTGSQLIANGAAVIGGTNSGTGVAAGGTGSVTVSNGGTLQTGAITVEAGSSLTVGQGSTLDAPLLTLQGGSANLFTLLSQTVVDLVAPISPPPLAGAELLTLSGATVAGADTGSSLTLHAVSGAASVNGFTFGDSIDLAGITGQSGLQSTVAVGSGTLTVNTASGVTSYLSEDGQGGTMITPTSTSIGVYRFFDSTDGIQFLTTSSTEASTIMQTLPAYVYEGASDMAALTPGNGDPNAAPIYRFFDTQDGSHFYTASTAERDSIINTRPDMVYESNSVIYEHLTPQPGDIAVYRFFETTNGSHFYTDSATEQASLLATRPDMVSEGIAFYEAPHSSVT